SLEPVEAMTSCLYECLREVGLQRHYPCFTAMGLRRAGHLSLLTMGDYSSVGVHSMGDRARLFHLVQLVKSLEEEEEEEEDHGGHDDDRVVITRKTFTSGSKVPACRQLDFDGSPIHKTQISGTPMRSCPHKQTVRRSTVHRSNSKVTQRQGVCIYKEGTTIGSGPRPEVRREADGTSRRTDGTSRRTDEPTYMYTSRRTIGEQRISVCVRKRPLTNAENRRGEADVVTAHDGDSVVVHESKEAVDLTQYILQHRFNYDEVFGEESSNVDVYLKTAFPLIQHVLNGGKATCFAYGQTGAGKTHTMLGCPPQRQGLYALAARDIFTQLHSTQDCGNSAVTSHVYVSFFEIYCGQLYDLLDRRKRLFAREDGHQVVQIAGLREVKVESVNSLLEVILWGTGERTQGVSGVNPVSSRSHALLQIQLRDSGHRATGRMSFVDLAGSERAADSRDPDRLSRMEGAEINQSLLALKECIRSLDQEQSHTPFRQSKLTQVLKDSFVGDSKTCMIANVSPGHLATKHTLNTLRYADRVKELRGGGGRRRPTVTPSPSPEHDQTSSIGTSASRGKSPPKGVKLGGHREAPNVTSTPARRLAPGGALLCSTPKGQGAGEGFGRGREDLCLEHTTPVRGSLGRGLWRRRRREGGRTTLWEIPSEGRATTKKTAEGQRELGEVRERDRRTSTEWERERETETPRELESEKERERHLRRYHQQLQQMQWLQQPLPASPSVCRGVEE
uniref:Kinesin-like protein n=1 Tax=Oncorhynchus kisutch TaxID=8019 RepID=A0A8C7I2Z7_ONCKI